MPRLGSLTLPYNFNNVKNELVLVFVGHAYDKYKETPLAGEN